MGETDLFIITHRKAQEVDGVIDAVRAKGLSVERVNLCQYPEQATFSWSPDTDSKTPFAAAKVGWFHNPGRYSITRTLEGHGRELALRECEGFWEGLALANDCHWLNNPKSLILSSRKIGQISTARRLGITVPETLVSNDPIEAAEFLAKHEGAVVKSLANGFSVYGEEQLKLYSRYYSTLPSELTEGLQYSPMVFQRRIRKSNELRVTCVDGTYFGLIANTSDLSSENIDIRRLDYSAEQERFRGIDVPSDVARASQKLMDNFSLSYAGLDWIQDTDGSWCFLELNAMGAFKWSELQGAGNITDTLANAIIRRAESDVDTH